MEKVVFGPLPFEGRPAANDSDALRSYHQRKKGHHHASGFSQKPQNMRVFNMPEYIVLVDAEGHFLCLLNAKTSDILDAGIMRYESKSKQQQRTTSVFMRTVSSSASSSTSAPSMRLGPDDAIPLGTPFEECFFDHTVLSKARSQNGAEIDSDNDADDINDDDEEEEGVPTGDDDMEVDNTERRLMEKRASEEMAMRDAEMNTAPHSEGFRGDVRRAWNKNVVRPVNRAVIQPMRQAYNQRRILRPPSYSRNGWHNPTSYSPGWRNRYRYYAPYIPPFYAASLPFALWFPTGRYIYLKNQQYGQYNLPPLPSIPFNAGPEAIEAQLMALRSRFGMLRQQGYEIVPYFYNDDMRPGRFTWVVLQNSGSYANFQGAQVYGDQQGGGYF